MIVMPAGDDRQDRYIALEGNRRLVALKVLEAPDTFAGAVDQAVLADLRKASKRYLQNPIDAIDCLVVKDRDEAQHWIQLRHTGQNEGAGIVPWGSDDVSRFRARTGTVPVHSQAMDLLEKHGDITHEERKKIPATSYKRLLETPAVREKCGFEVQSGELRLLADEGKVRKALHYIAKELLTGRIKTKDIYTTAHRENFAASLPSSVVVKPTTGIGKGVKISGITATAKPKPAATSVRERDVLIPKDCVLNVTLPRLKDMESELRRLNLGIFKNAISVLFRVFIELSVDTYSSNKKLGISEREKLGAKLNGVVKDLESRKKLDGKQAKVVRRFAAKDSFLAPSVTMMHEYVHNPHFFPVAGDMRDNWNNLQPFLMAIWSP
jgi:hypothetical protein